jgi:hypothetical protein
LHHIGLWEPNNAARRDHLVASGVNVTTIQYTPDGEIIALYSDPADLFALASSSSTRRGASRWISGSPGRHGPTEPDLGGSCAESATIPVQNREWHRSRPDHGASSTPPGTPLLADVDRTRCRRHRWRAGLDALPGLHREAVHPIRLDAQVDALALLRRRARLVTGSERSLQQRGRQVGGTAADDVAVHERIRASFSATETRIENAPSVPEGTISRRSGGTRS